MKIFTTAFLHVIARVALCFAHFKQASFWRVAAYVWGHCGYVAQTAIGPYPRRPIYLRLIDEAIAMPNAEYQLTNLLSKNNDRLSAYCLLALKRIGRLDAATVSKINSDGLIVVATGQFRVETNLKKFAHDLMLK